MKRFLAILGVVALGFVLGAATYLLIEPYLPLLPGLVMRTLDVVRSGWFLAGLVGSILALYLLVRWARSEEW